MHGARKPITETSKKEHFKFAPMKATPPAKEEMLQFIPETRHADHTFLPSSDAQTRRAKASPSKDGCAKIRNPPQESSKNMDLFSNDVILQLGRVLILWVIFSVP